MAGLIERCGLWSDEQARMAREVAERVSSEGLDTIRFSFADQHGILRGKSLVADELDSAFYNGVTMTTTLLLKDTSHRTVYPVWQSGAGLGDDRLTGAGDFVMVPDPSTFRILPWAPSTGWMQCDIVLADGRPVPFCTRSVLRDALGRLADRGLGFRAGVEMEFHVFELVDAKLDPVDAGQPATPPEVGLLAHGFQYLTEQRLDEIEPVIELLRSEMEGLELPLRSMEVEFGPSQFEFTFRAGEGLDPADCVVLFRSAVKQICRRNGFHATFMCRPGLPNIFSSGWHLHQSLFDTKTGDGVFVSDDENQLLSEDGRHYVGGLLAHARESAVFTTPTVNGYKRYRPHTLAPDRVVWGRDNKGAMIRAIGAPGDPATRVENRAGEPAANPYLYMASQILCGLDGLDHRRDPGPATDEPYSADASRLPRSLMEAVSALRESAFYRSALGDDFVDYMVTLKEAEIGRFLGEVTDWEHREYFEIF